MFVIIPKVGKLNVLYLLYVNSGHNIAIYLYVY